MSLGQPRPFDPSQHRTEAFRCGRQELDRWVQAYAGQGQRRDASRTYVVVDRENAVVGFYTLVATQVDHGRATADVRRGMSKRFPIPGVLLARLAVDRPHHGRGVGAALLADAVRRVVRVADDVGIRTLVVDAIDDKAADFYRRFGFTSVTENRLLLMTTVAQLRSAEPRS